MKLNELKKINTGMLNTPLHKLENISKDTGVNIYIKRDDLTGYGFGGNKLRKLDYLLAEAIEQGCNVLLTYGGPQTNHGRLTAAVAARYGLKCGIIMDGPAPEKATGNLILDKMFNADLYFMDDTDFKNDEDYSDKYNKLKEKATNAVIKKYEDNGDKVYSIPVGGSSVLGAVGYLQAIDEINKQLEEKNIVIDHMVSGYGSCGTYAGLLLGSKYYESKFDVIGICVSHKNDEAIQKHIEYMNEISKTYELDIEITKNDIRVEKGYVGIGYNIPDEETRKCVYYVAGKESVVLDPCYTGKAFNGLLKMIESGKIAKGSNVLFLHTGGTPGIFSEGHSSAMQEELWGEEKSVFKL